MINGIKKNDWTCAIDGGEVTDISQVWIVDEINDAQVTAKQWRDLEVIATQSFALSELRLVTFAEFIRVLTKVSNKMIIRN